MGKHTARAMDEALEDQDEAPENSEDALKGQAFGYRATNVVWRGAPPPADVRR